MDQLKYINDSFGHAEGDFAIKTVAYAIKKAGGQDSVCARFGGDEFVCAIAGNKAGEYTEEVFCKWVDEAIASSKDKGLERDKMFLAADRTMYARKAERKKARIL